MQLVITTLSFIDDCLNNVLTVCQCDGYENPVRSFSVFETNPKNYHEVVVQGECCKDGIGKIFIFVDYHWGLDFDTSV